MEDTKVYLSVYMTTANFETKHSPQGAVSVEEAIEFLEQYKEAKLRADKKENGK